jgi:hypothetical protein
VRRADRRGLHRDRWRLTSGLALATVVALSAVLAVLLHRNGHTQGDDFALYLRQARSVFDGDVGQVVADNRFSVINSGGAFSPIAYPWGLPLLLSPFVRFWGLDYDRLKLVIVAVFCIWLVLVHGVVRRRLGRVPALVVALTVGTVPVLLIHTDQLLSEFPQAMAVAVLVWWLDRIRRRADEVTVAAAVGPELDRPAGSLIGASTRDLVVVGLLVAVAFNVRRESLVLVGAIAIVQMVELVAAGWRRRRQGLGLRSPAWVPWRSLALPHVAFAVAAVAFQLLLPTMLLPDNADSGPKHIVDRLQDYPRVLSEQLGLYPHQGIGVAVLALAGIGIVVGVVRRPRFDGHLAAITVLSVLAVSTHFRFVGRYYFQVVPWILYFGTVAVLAAFGWVRRWWKQAWVRRTVLALGLVPLVILLAVHANKLPSRISAARDFDAAGRQQVGPTHPNFVPIFDAVAAHTGPDDVILYFRARTMTLLTDRRAIQTTNIERAEQRADFFAMQRWSDFYEPTIDETEAMRRGYEPVWQDANWILYDLHPD